MTDEQIIEMAKRAGFKQDPLGVVLIPAEWTFIDFNLAILSFARLIEASVREECAALCDDYCEVPCNSAAAIREGK